MYKKVNLKCVGEGVLRGTVVTLILILIYTAITTVVEDSFGFKSAMFMIITCISVLYGAAYAAKKANKNGWINGLCVGLCYCAVIYIISIIAGREFVFSSRDALRVLAAVAVGTLSGMLGINA